MLKEQSDFPHIYSMQIYRHIINTHITLSLLSIFRNKFEIMCDAEI